MTFPVLSASTPLASYNLTRSLRFRSSASAYLNRTPASSGNQQKFTWSSWVKLGALGTNIVLFSTNVAPSARFQIGTASNALSVAYNDGSSWVFDVATTAVYRDPSAWYHIVIYIDTTQATATNRAIIYVNNVSIAYTGTNCPLNQNFNVNTAVVHSIGRLGNGTSYLDGYLAEVNFVDGQALTPSSFGSTNSTTGVWQPARYTGTYGTNGFYLPFTDNSALTTASNAGLGKDFSGNANYWVTNNISITAGATYDSMTDVPTLTSATAANYATFNPIATTATTPTFSNGNLQIATPGSGCGNSYATIGIPSSGKWYWEVTFSSGNNPMIGVAPYSVTANGEAVTGALFYYNDGRKFISGTGSAYGASYTTGDVIGIAADADTGAVTFYKNNTSQGSVSISLTNTFPSVCDADPTTNSATLIANFGQRPFSYTPPSGFVALNTYNLPASTVPNGASYMAATLYTGTSASLTVANTVGSASFQPDWVWIKSRSAATDHKLTDSVRGVTKGLISNTTGAETTDTGGLTAFGSTGFTVSTNNDYNTSAATYVAWNWKAGGTGVTNTNGTITSTVSANTTSGFSVVTYTGNGSSSATVGHGLGVTPSMIIHSARSTTTSWFVNHVGIPNLWMQLYIYFTASSGGGTNGAIGYQSTNTSTTFGFTAGSSTVNNVNQSAATYVAYCFTPIKGFSAFGSYTGNSSTDGPFVYLGFRPRWIMLKNSNENYDWYIFDTSRNTYNLTNISLYPDLSNGDGTPSTAILDILSNGFKLRGTSGGTNPVSTSTMVYAAFAENPFQNALAR